MRPFAVGMLAALSLQSAEPWIRLKSANFELFTTAGERKGKEGILYFEQMRTLFLRLSSGSQAITQPVRLIAFRGEKDYTPYRPSDAAVAFYLPGNDRDHIVMKSLAGEFYPTALHEYAHLITKHSGAKFPPWLDEGIAELYASTKPVGGKIQIGGILAGRAHVLGQTKFIPLDTLFAVGHNSPLYNEKDRAGMFYAQSWLLAHMLHFSPEYRTKATQFLLQTGRGKHSAEAFFEVYGKSTQAVEKDLRTYYSSGTIFVVILDAKLEKSTEEPEVSTPEPLEVKLALGDLLANMEKKQTEAEAIYKELIADYPDNPDVLAAMGWLQLHHGERDRAAELFGKAVDKGSKSARLHHTYALLLWSSAENDSKRVVELMRKAVALDPALKDGQWDLAMAAMNSRDYKTAALALGKLKTITPDRAYQYFSTAAFCNYHLGAYAAARKSLSQALEHAKTPEQGASLENLSKAIDYKENPPKVVTFVPEAPVPAAAAPAPVETPPAAEQSKPPRLTRRQEQAGRVFEAQTTAFPTIDGALRQVDCLGKQARLQIDAAGKRVAFLIRDPQEIVIRNSGEVTHEFTCGPQKGTAVKVEFTAEPGLPAGITGYVRALEFR